MRIGGIPPETAGRWPLRLRPRHPLAGVLVLATAALVIAPLLSLIHIALEGDSELWPHLAAYVLPQALTDTLLLLAGVAAIAAGVGVGCAWIVTAYEFPG